MARLPSVLGTDDLSLPELCAARLDGEVVALAGGWVPIDEPDLPSLRARALAGGVGPLIIERLSAAWVHGSVVAVPRVGQFCLPSHARTAVAPEVGRQVREVGIDAEEIVEIGGCPCTTPLRTAFDLLRDHTTEDALVVGAVAGLIETGAIAYEDVRRRVEASGRMPHKRLALARLALVERATSGEPSTPALGG
ncbi:type IV toxin-antitoxin system AbiEi family antitoxin [Agromyces soli]